MDYSLPVNGYSVWCCSGTLLVCFDYRSILISGMISINTDANS